MITVYINTVLTNNWKGLASITNQATTKILKQKIPS